MSKTFERPEDVVRENKAIKAFCDKYDFSYKKQGKYDPIDFSIHDGDGLLIGYVEVKGRMRNVLDAFPLPLSDRKLTAISKGDISSVIIWACFDGIIWSNVKRLKGDKVMGGRKPRKGSVNDIEMMYYYKEKDNTFRELIY